MVGDKVMGGDTCTGSCHDAEDDPAGRLSTEGEKMTWRGTGRGLYYRERGRGMKPELGIVDGLFTVHRFPPDHAVPAQVFDAPFYSITRSDEELAVVCPASAALQSERSESGWACIKVLGPLDFSLTGILAGIAAVLADAEISIFAVSTFDTDYILVKAERLSAARRALTQAGYAFRG